MLLFYTGPKEPFSPQQDPTQSLGGYIASTFVPNSVLNSIFNSIFLHDFGQNKSGTRLLALKNTFPAKKSNIRIWTETPLDSVVQYKIGLADIMYDDCGKPFFEYLQQEDSLPFYSTLASHETEENKTTAFDLEKGEYKGLWIRREMRQSIPEQVPPVEGINPLEAIKALKDEQGFDLDGEKIIEALNKVGELEQKEEEVKLIIEWD